MIKKLKMDNMHAFIEELCDNTANTILSNHRTDQANLIKNITMETCIAHMVSDILVDCKGSMVTASKYGHYEAILWEGTCQEVYMDYNALFLLKGPRPCKVHNPYDAGLSYFDRRGIIPVVRRVCQYLAPLPVFMRYDHKTHQHQLVVSWNNT